MLESSGLIGTELGPSGVSIFDNARRIRWFRIISGSNPYAAQEIYLPETTGTTADTADGYTVTAAESVLWALDGSTSWAAADIVVGFPNPHGSGFVGIKASGAGGSLETVNEDGTDSENPTTKLIFDEDTGVTVDVTGLAAGENKVVMLSASTTQMGVVNTTSYQVLGNNAKGILGSRYALGGSRLLDASPGVYKVADEYAFTVSGDTQPTVAERAWQVSHQVASSTAFAVTSDLGGGGGVMRRGFVVAFGTWGQQLPVPAEGSIVSVYGDSLSAYSGGLILLADMKYSAYTPSSEHNGGEPALYIGLSRDFRTGEYPRVKNGIVWGYSNGAVSPPPPVVPIIPPPPPVIPPPITTVSPPPRVIEVPIIRPEPFGSLVFQTQDRETFRAMLPQFTSTARGIVPLSGGGTTNFLRADGTWTAPTATPGSYTTVSVIGTVTYSSAADCNKVILVSNAGIANTINIPAAATAGAGAWFVVKDMGGSAGTGNITIDASGAETIDGAATLVLNSNYQSVTIVCDGSGWGVI